jgi:putative SOS response-associated peptidase YedK
MFCSAFTRSRYIIPASGYYEWRAEHGSEQPYYFSAADADVLLIAELWDQWRDLENGKTSRLLHHHYDRGESPLDG